GDGVFIGSDTQLIAPVTVGPGAIIAAGTTVTEDVPQDALVIARVSQVNRIGGAARWRALQTDENREAVRMKRETTPPRATPHDSRLTRNPSSDSKAKPVKKMSRG